MKFNILKVITIGIIFNLNILNSSAEKVAILISAGETLYDDAETHSEYWYDLFSAYKELISLGYTHNHIIVLYGSGEDFESIHDEYNPATYGWDKIVDLDNRKETINKVINGMRRISGAEADLMIRWVVGHGSVSNYSGKYQVTIENTNEIMDAESILAKISLIKNFRSVCLVWMTCHSGCLVNNAFNQGLCILTSSSCDEYSWSAIYNGIPRSEMNYAFDTKLSNNIGKVRLNYNFRQMGEYMLNYNFIRSSPKYYDSKNVGSMIKFKF